jgi:hypothetical protein
MFTVGVRGHLLATKHAISLLAGRAGVIVSTQERLGDDQHFGQNIVVDSAAKRCNGWSGTSPENSMTSRSPRYSSISAGSGP